MKKIILLLLAVVIIPSAQAQYKSLELTDATEINNSKIELTTSNSKSPKLDAGNMAMQFVAGNFGGVLVGFGGAIIGTGIAKAGGSHGEYAGFGGAFIGFVAGHCAGSILGVYGVGSARDVQGDVGATIIGGVLGTGAGLGTLYYARGDENLMWSTLTYPTVGAMIGFNSTLTDKKNVSEIKESGTHFKIKNDIEVNVIKINFEIPKSLAQSLQF